MDVSSLVSTYGKAGYSASLTSKSSGLAVLQSYTSSATSSANTDIFSLGSQLSLMHTTGYQSLVRSYYSTSSSESADTTESTATDTNYTSVKNNATELTTSASKLYTTGSSSLFKEDSNGEIDMDELYSAVSDYVSDYNTAISSAYATKNTAITGIAGTMVSTTKNYESQLAEIGITINDDNSLSIDESTFTNADVDTIKSLFNGTSSYAYAIGSKSMSLASTSALQAVYNSTGANSTTYSLYI